MVRCGCLKGEKIRFLPCTRRCRAKLISGKGVGGVQHPCVLFVANDAPRQQRNSTVVYFGGDMQDRTAKDMRAAGTGAFGRYNLQATAESLVAKHHATRCLCVRAYTMVEGCYAHYEHFCPTLEEDNTIPSYDGQSGRATEHLAALLDSTLGSSWEDGTLELVAFSHGLVVINQLLAELANTPVEDTAKGRAIRRLWSRVRAIHDVDGANDGPHYPPPRDGAQAVIRWWNFAREVGADASELSWHMHCTDYTHTLDFENAPEKEPEQSAFVEAVRSVSRKLSHNSILQVQSYDGKSLKAHFRCLDEYHVPPPPRACTEEVAMKSD